MRRTALLKMLVGGFLVTGIQVGGVNVAAAQDRDWKDVRNDLFQIAQRHNAESNLLQPIANTQVSPDATIPSGNASAAEAAIINAADTQRVARDQALQALANKLLCGTATTLCFDQDGAFVEGKSGISELQPGQRVTVHILGWEIPASRFKIKFNVAISNDSLENESSVPPLVKTAPSPPADVAALTIVAKNVAAAPVPAPQVILTMKSVAVTANNISVTAYFQRSAITPVDPTDPTTSAVAAQHEVYVDPGRYYVDLGVMVPFTIDRKVVSTANLATGERTLGVETNVRITPAFVVNAYPGGRLRGRISSFTSRTPADKWASALGVQVGTGLNFASNPFGEIYGGAIFTPFSGVSFSAGLALVNEQVLPEGANTGMILNAGTAVTPETRYMLWPYVGISATLDFFDVIKAGYLSVTGGGT